MARRLLNLRTTEIANLAPTGRCTPRVVAQNAESACRPVAMPTAPAYVGEMAARSVAENCQSRV